MGIVIVAGIVGFIVNLLLGMALGGGVLLKIIAVAVNLLLVAGFITLFCKSPYGRSLGMAAA